MGSDLSILSFCSPVKWSLHLLCCLRLIRPKLLSNPHPNTVNGPRQNRASVPAAPLPPVPLIGPNPPKDFLQSHHAVEQTFIYGRSRI
jgi:hypothetical protein